LQSQQLQAQIKDFSKDLFVKALKVFYKERSIRMSILDSNGQVISSSLVEMRELSRNPSYRSTGSGVFELSCVFPAKDVKKAKTCRLEISDIEVGTAKMNEVIFKKGKKYLLCWRLRAREDVDTKGLI